MDKVPSLKLIISFDKLDIEAIRTQTAKVLMQLYENNTLIDDGASMYSFTSRHSESEI